MTRMGTEVVRAAEWGCTKIESVNYFGRALLIRVMRGHFNFYGENSKTVIPSNRSVLSAPAMRASSRMVSARNQ